MRNMLIAQSKSSKRKYAHYVQYVYTFFIIKKDVLLYFIF